MNLDKIREKTGYQPLLLGLVALLASASLAWAAHATKDAIAAAEAKDLRDSLSQVLPPGFADNDLLGDTIELAQADGSKRLIYRSRKAGQLNGAVFKVEGKGYAGPIQILMAVDQEGRILGVRVLKHTETPGLGDKIDVGKGGWVKTFDGKSLDDPAPGQWAVKKDGGVFDQFAGATITPRAVVKAVKGGLEFFSQHKSEIEG